MLTVESAKWRVWATETALGNEEASIADGRDGRGGKMNPDIDRETNARRGFKHFPRITCCMGWERGREA